MRKRLVLGVLTLIATLLAGCSPGGLFSADLMWVPHRAIAAQPDQSAAATRALMGGLLTRQVSLSEAQVTHLVRQLWRDVPEAERAVRDVRVLFEPDLIYVKVLLRQGVLPGVPTDAAINVAGRLVTVDGKLQLTVERIGLGVIPIAPAASLALLNRTLAATLQGQTGYARVVLEHGVLVIHLE